MNPVLKEMYMILSLNYHQFFCKFPKSGQPQKPGLVLLSKMNAKHAFKKHLADNEKVFSVDKTSIKLYP